MAANASGSSSIGKCPEPGSASIGIAGAAAAARSRIAMVGPFAPYRTIAGRVIAASPAWASKPRIAHITSIISLPPALLRSMFQRASRASSTRATRLRTSSMPWVGMQKFASVCAQRAPHSSNVLNGVSTITADSVRAAWVAAKPMVIVPPHEQPDTWAAGMHRLSMKAASAAQ